MAPSQSPSRRTSQGLMVPPAIPYGANSHGGDHAGPLRHPKPLTPAELHLMLEQEQEAVVNRLTRELSLLRQQTASVASTASSTSTTFNDPLDQLHFAGSTHPTLDRRHRSSSSLSSYIPVVQGSRTGSVTGIAPARDSGIPSARSPIDRQGRSRAPSITSPRLSEGASSSFLSSPLQLSDHFPHINHPQRNPLQVTSPTSPMSRFEEAVHYRGELESVKRENEALRKRVKDLELALKKLREQETTSTDEAVASSAAVSAPPANET